MNRCLWFVGAVLSAAAAIASERTLVEGIVVRVNDRILTVADMRKRASERAAETGTPVPPADYPQLVKEAADDICMLERAIELKIEVTPEEISDSIKSLREQNRFENDEQFDQALKSMGMTLEELRNRMRDQMLINRVLSREMGNVPITEEELRQRYEREKSNYSVPERVHLQHLVFSVGAGDEARVRASAQRLVQAARNGSDFSALLKQEVADGAASGGDLGVVALTDLRPEVRSAVATMKPGEISDPIVSPAGLHVVRLLERIPPGFKPFAEVSDELRQREMADRYRTKMHSVVDDLKKRYVVEVHPELFTPPST
jgi:peptidyl-prolyl cis-trans isomerase SurA